MKLTQGFYVEKASTVIKYLHTTHAKLMKSYLAIKSKNKRILTTYKTHSIELSTALIDILLFKTYQAHLCLYSVLESIPSDPVGSTWCYHHLHSSNICIDCKSLSGPTNETVIEQIISHHI